MDRYEHHDNLEKNKLCPFKLGSVSGTIEDVYNWHRNMELILVTEGNGRIRYGVDEISLSKGDVAIISSNVMHRLYAKDMFSYYYFIIGDHFCLENGIVISDYLFEPKVHDETLNMLYLAIVEKLAQTDREGNATTVLALRCAVLSLLLYIVTNYSKPIDKKDLNDASEEYIKRAVTYLSEHYTEAIQLDSLADFCGISKYHLSREFKKHTGQTVFSYLNKLRCKQASLLLSEGKTVTEAAYACGYESMSYFSRVFTKHMGIAPSAFKV